MVKVIIIIAVVGFCVSCLPAERAETEFSGTATYSGTWSTDKAPLVPVPFGRTVPMWPKLSGTCELTVDFDRGTATVSFSGDRSATITMHATKFGEKGEVVTPYGVAYFLYGGKMINDWRWLVGCYFYAENPSKPGGTWSCWYEPHPGSRGRWIEGSWRAQKVSTG